MEGAGMNEQPSGRFIAVGECMVEMAPAGDDPALYRMGFAGDTFNTAWYARRLLGPDASVEYVSAVGTDEVSARMLAFMEGADIGTGHVARVADRTVGLYTIALKDGERSFSYWRSQSAARLLARQLPAPERFGAGDTLHFSGITLAILSLEDREALLSWCGALRTRGARIAFDPNVRPRLWEGGEAVAEWIGRAARVADVVLPSFDEEARDFGAATLAEVATRYLAAGARVVAVKNGEAPGLVATEAESGPYEPVAASRVVDTTAAGDSFDAGFLVGLMRGLPPIECAREGAELAAKVVGARGALVETAPDGD